MFSGEHSMVGTVTSVRASGGIPFEKSMRGNARGTSSSEARRLTRLTANWLMPSRSRTTKGAINQGLIPVRRTCSADKVPAAEIRNMDPLYENSPVRFAKRLSINPGDGRT